MVSSATQRRVQRNARNKEVVWDYWQGMNSERAAGRCLSALHPDVIWHGFRPLRHLQGADEVAVHFWGPLLAAIPDLLRRPYLFIGGEFEGAAWVCGTGDFVGTFARDWRFGGIVIPAGGSSVHFRFGEFCKIEDGRITELRVIIDLPDLLRQTGIRLFPPSRGRKLWIPGPLAGDGIRPGSAPEIETEKTLGLVESMIFGGLNQFDGKNQASQGLERFWHPHMVWHGPVGIGSAYGLDEFKRNAQGPIVHAFPDRRGIGHQARIADGHFAASTGWPSLVGTHVNDYMDWPPTGERIGWNIMDFWRRQGDWLQENWVLIDLIDAALASKVDLLAQLPKILNRTTSDQ
jgi:predicted ester cyclase